MAAIADGSGANRPPEILSSAQRERLQSNDGMGSLILRIKRKRGTDPISALRIETLLSKGINPSQVEEHARSLDGGEAGSPEDSAGASARPKRRLTERGELRVSSRESCAIYSHLRRTLGIFRLADTVSASSFASEASTRKLEQRITELKKTPASILVSEESTEGEKKRDATSDSKQPAKDAPESTLRFKIIKPGGIKSKQAALGSLKNKDSSSSLRSRAVHAKYNRNAGKGSISSLRRSSDASISSRKTTSSSRIRFIDAVMERSRSGVKQKDDVVKAKVPTSTDAEMDSLDRRFADLLGNYLKENDLEPPEDLYDSSVVTDARREAESSGEDSEGDYVYDIYFREKETMWGSGPAGASDAGLRPAQVAGHEVLGPAFEVPAEAQYTNEPMATLVGFSDEDDLIAEMENASMLMGQENLGDSDDEFDEGEDEDSNDEGFYRNDYPEDEGVEEDEVNQAGWGWSGPRRRGQRHSSDEEEDDNDSDDSDSDIHN
jgi:hypothetical protein